MAVRDPRVRRTKLLVIYGLGHTDPATMEHIDGDLEDVLRTKPLTAPEAARIVRGPARGAGWLGR